MNILQRIHKYWFGTNTETQAALQAFKIGRVTDSCCSNNLDAEFTVDETITISAESIIVLWMLGVYVRTSNGLVDLPITWKERKQIFALVKERKKQHRQNQLNDVALQLDLD